MDYTPMSRGEIKMQDLYKINQIASLFGISRDTLRLYEKTGLINPAFTDENTKYRYYGVKEILQLDYIIQLKGMGITLSEINKILDCGFDLKKRRDILEKRFKNLKNLLNIYDDLMNEEGYVIEQKTYPEHYAITKAVSVKNWKELIGVFSELTYQAIIDKCTYKTFTHPYAIFENDFSFTDFSCTACLEMEAKSDNVTFFPKQKYLCLKYKGNYENLNKAYERLYIYAKEKSISLLPYAVERYIVAYDNNQLSSNYITEINLPIAPKKDG